MAVACPYRRRRVRVQVEIMEKRLTASFNARFNPCPPQRRGKKFSVIARTGASLSRGADDRLQVGADGQTDFLFVENGFVLGWTRLIKTDTDAKDGTCTRREFTSRWNGLAGAHEGETNRPEGGDDYHPYTPPFQC